MAETTASGSYFRGSKQDLEQFTRLVQSPIRSDAREHALQDWEEYKLGRQAAFVLEGRAGTRWGKRGIWKKGEYIRSLTAPAIDLRGATFEDVILGYADLRGILFDEAKFLLREREWIALKGARLEGASLRKAELHSARLIGADLRRADLRGAQLIGADLSGANLEGADLSGADLRDSDLQRANFVGVKLRGTNLCRSRVYGIAAWDVEVDDDDTLYRDLVVTPQEPHVTVDNIEVAQFVYLLLSNPRIRGAINTVCRKGVLILGRFTTPERKAVLDQLRAELRRRDFVPIVFDFVNPSERDFTEIVKIIAGMSLFIIADITNPKSSPLELAVTVPDFAVPLVPIIAEGESPFSMFRNLQNKYEWVLDVLSYKSVEELVRVIEPAIIAPARAKHTELLEKKAQEVRIKKASDYFGY